MCNSFALVDFDQLCEMSCLPWCVCSLVCVCVPWCVCVCVPWCVCVCSPVCVCVCRGLVGVHRERVYLFAKVTPAVNPGLEQRGVWGQTSGQATAEEHR